MVGGALGFSAGGGRGEGSTAGDPAVGLPRRHCVRRDQPSGQIHALGHPPPHHARRSGLRGGPGGPGGAGPAMGDGRRSGGTGDDRSGPADCEADRVRRFTVDPAGNTLPFGAVCL